VSRLATSRSGLKAVSSPSVYLAGPITGLTWDEAEAWRLPDSQTATTIARYGGAVLNPMRDQHKWDTGGPLPDNFDGSTGIQEDFRMIEECSAILANFVGAKAVSLGTIAELGYGYAMHKPIVVAMEPDNIHNHAFIREMATTIRPTLVGAASAVGFLIETTPVYRDAVAVPYA